MCITNDSIMFTLKTISEATGIETEHLRVLLTSLGIQPSFTYGYRKERLYDIYQLDLASQYLMRDLVMDIDLENNECVVIFESKINLETL